MSIDLETVTKLGKLSMLEFDQSHTEEIQEELAKILSFVSQLQEVDTTGVEPMTSVVEGASTPERQDDVSVEDKRDAFLNVSPASEMGFYVVPRVIE